MGLSKSGTYPSAFLVAEPISQMTRPCKGIVGGSAVLKDGGDRACKGRRRRDLLARGRRRRILSYRGSRGIRQQVSTKASRYLKQFNNTHVHMYPCTVEGSDFSLFSLQAKMSITFKWISIYSCCRRTLVGNLDIISSVSVFVSLETPP